MQHAPKAHTRKQSSFLPWLICIMAAVFYCYEYLLRILPSVINNDLMRDYNLDAAGFGHLAAFYYYAYTPLQVLVGVLMDKIKPRRLLTFACLLCAFGAYIFTSPELHIVKLGRFLMGAGSAFAFVGALKLATLWLPPNRFGFLSGLITCLGSIGAMAGDILIEKWVVHDGWMGTVHSLAFIGVILSAILWLIVRDKNPAVEYIHTHIEATFKEVLQGLVSLMKKRQLWMNGLMGCLLYMPLSVFADQWGIIYLEQAHHLDHSLAAQANSFVFLGWAIGGPLSGTISDLMQRRRLPILIASFLSFLSITYFMYTTGHSALAIFTFMFCLGFFSSSQILVFAIGRESSSKHVAATAIAFTNMVVMIGGALFQPLVGCFLNKVWDGTIVDGVHYYSPENYQFAMSLLPIGIFIGFLITAFCIKETYCHIKEEN